MGATFQGRCHCGNVTVTFETSKDPATLSLRECACSFCRRHGARTVTDPQGSLTLRTLMPEALSRYQFGMRIAEFWVCSRCGVYVAAVMREPDRAWASVNTRCFDDASSLTSPPQSVSYDDEDPAARRARRRERWTPARVLEP